LQQETGTRVLITNSEVKDDERNGQMITGDPLPGVPRQQLLKESS
jgi:hypothetical protein